MSLSFTLSFWEWSLITPNPKSDSGLMAEHASWHRTKSLLSRLLSNHAVWLPECEFLHDSCYVAG